jgi:hypothetical protein
MTALEVLLALAGLVVTVLVVAGMILITPHGEVQLDDSVGEQQGANLSRADVPGSRASPRSALGAFLLGVVPLAVKRAHPGGATSRAAVRGPRSPESLEGEIVDREPAMRG